MSPTTRFILISLSFHLLYTASIFDIYFTSPVVHPARRFSPQDAFIDADAHRAPVGAPADRLVLIVGDGLRADTLFKRHSPSLLPAWATPDVLSTGQVGAAAALLPAKNWTRDHTVDTLTRDIDTFDPAPFLRHAAQNRGAWGVSHTRVPTESRPGHVALIAGMYEDVSAVTKGWKLNPVSFDSVFNQSSHTFAFGSPDILPMFATGATPNKVDMQSYAEEEEDFTSDATELDVWVLDRLRELLQRGETNATLSEQLRRPKTVFFLHLLGLDTTGHTYRPKSAEYVGNLMVVDAIAAATEQLLASFYGPEGSDRTAYVFTADHGMSNKGNHGDGEPDNTRTPLIAWGAGIRKPRAEAGKQTWRIAEQEQDDYYQGWHELDNLWREDVEQADITPLMSALLGINIPANSEGMLPLDYLDIPAEEAARAMLANALEMLEVYRVKHIQRSRRMLRYVPFPGLPSEGDSLPGTQDARAIRDKLAAGAYLHVIKDCEILIQKAAEGARYLQMYDWLLLVSIIVTGYLGSMAYSATFLLRHYVLTPDQLSDSKQRPHGLRVGRVVVSTGLALLWAKFAAEQSPWTYYPYAAFAAFYWIRVTDESDVLALAWRAAVQHYQDTHSTRPKVSLAISLVVRVTLSLAALELMVVGYLHRFAWTVGFIFLGLIWPAAGILTDVKHRHEVLIILWFICCALCSLFTAGDVEKEESVGYLVASGLAFLVAGVSIVNGLGPFMHVVNAQGVEQSKPKTSQERLKKVLYLQLVVLVISTIVTASSSTSLQQKKGLPRVNQIAAWWVLAISIFVPFVYGFQRRSTGQSEASQPPSQRLTIVVFAFAPLFVLLSIRDETLFFGCYTLTLLVWAKLEASLFEERLYQRNVGRQDNKSATSSIATKQTAGRSLEKEDIRVAICFLFFLHVGFFGTGNVASISSFYLSPVYRLVPIFSPFLMAALLILKILVPFIVLASVVQMLCLTPPHAGRTSGLHQRKTGKELAGPPLLGVDAVGGMGLRDAYGLIMLACLFTDVLALNFLLTVRTQGSWLEIGRSITHFAMSNLLQVFMLALGAAADVVVGR